MTWGLLDFAVAILLVGSALIAFALVTKLTQNRAYRLVAWMGLLALLALVWAELAVGVFD